MPLDAFCLQNVVREVAGEVTGARIEKIQQPARDQVILLLSRSRRLLLCAGSNQPHLQMTAAVRDNPSQPPMFCMLLRKYLSSGKIISLTQPAAERVVELAIDATDEMGEQSRYTLVLEAIGRSANLLLLDRDGRIMDCLRRVDGDWENGRRALLPGLFYHLPPAQDKADPLQTDDAAFAQALSCAAPEGELEKWFLDTFAGISPLIAREILCRAGLEADARLCGVSDAQRVALAGAFAAWREDVRQNRTQPTLLLREGKPVDFTYYPVLQYGTAMESEIYPTFSALMDTFYAKREQADRVRQRGQDLRRTAANARDRLRRKIAAQEKEYAQTQNRDALRLNGELITANLYRMKKGKTVLTAENYYADGCPEVKIRLDPLLTPQQNAAKYFKQYNKAKTAEVMLAQQLQKGRAELAYLESVLEEIERAESEQDFNDIRAELSEGGYLRSRSKAKGGFQRASRPREFCSSTGYKILVGRNNRQNDRLTAKDALRTDLWLHVQKAHGSHVIVCTGGAEADEQTVREAAVLAAYYSQSREGENVAVDYTPVKFVKKPAGARPGMVIYTTCRTVYVTPEEKLVQALQVK